MASTADILDIDIRGLSADSRHVGQGYLFAAIPGSLTDGRNYIAQAIDKGAVAVLAPSGTKLADYGVEESASPCQIITDDNPRRRLAKMAARFYGKQPATIAAVTGTNGKTSVASFTRQIWQHLGHKASSLGTLGLTPPRPDAPASLTTPDPVDLHRCLAALQQDGIEHLVLEASSHGLDQFRLDGLRVSAAAFTNLSRDHLDYHHGMDAYLGAKLRLFTDLLAADGTAVLNADQPAFETIRAACEQRGIKVIRYGIADSELRLLTREATPSGQRLLLDIFGLPHAVDLPLVGTFQVENVLAALGLVIATGAEPKEALSALTELTGAPGRLELVAQTRNGGSVYVDYAHTPDALKTVLEAVRPHTAGILAVVFGCGGDRDQGKRPIMGEIAQQLADRAIVTDDNPRNEDPAAIRRAIMAAAPAATEIGDRGAAIAAAVAHMGPGDVLVIAGKGHESGQIVGGQILPFDDRDVARAAIAKLESGDP